MRASVLRSRCTKVKMLPDYTLGFSYRGVVGEPLTYILNGHGRKYEELPREYAWVMRDYGVLLASV